MTALHDTPKHRDLIYDVGLHRGEDTDFYLQKGFRVIAFEANASLVKECENRFRNYIDDGRLIIIEGAIVDPSQIEPGQRMITFYENQTHAFLGTVNKEWAERNDLAGTPSAIREVPVTDFSKVLQQYGVPYYLKIDIEGCDMVCVETLKAFHERPDYLSIESDKTSLANIQRELDALVELGYESFKAVEQSSIPSRQVPPDPPLEGAYVKYQFENGASGLFGREVDGAWRSRNAIARRYRGIRLGYMLAGDDGVVWNWQFPGATKLREAVLGTLRYLYGSPGPYWYDTHARHRSARS